MLWPRTGIAQPEFLYATLLTFGLSWEETTLATFRVNWSYQGGPLAGYTSSFECITVQDALAYATSELLGVSLLLGLMGKVVLSQVYSSGSVTTWEANWTRPK